MGSSLSSAQDLPILVLLALLLVHDYCCSYRVPEKHAIILLKHATSPERSTVYSNRVILSSCTCVQKTSKGQ